MLDSTTTNNLKSHSELSALLEPVNPELRVLEIKLIENLSGDNPILNNIIQYIISAGGKRLRPAISFLFAKALNKGFVSSNHFKLGQAVELIHTATLIHDDVIDGTETRRNRETVNNRWNDKAAIIAGDFLLAKSLSMLSEIKNYSVIDIFADMMAEICEGEIQQDTQSFKFISLEQYIKKSKRKTANLFVAGAQSAAILTPDADNLIVRMAKDYALGFGISFQIMDDILNFTSTENELGKPTGIDLKDGILTAPVLFALEEYEQKGDFTLRNLIEKEFEDNSEFDKAIDLIFNSKAIEKSKELAVKYAVSAAKSLNDLENSIYKDALKDLSDYVIRRKY